MSRLCSTSRRRALLSCCSLFRSSSASALPASQQAASPLLAATAAHWGSSPLSLTSRLLTSWAKTRKSPEAAAQQHQRRRASNAEPRRQAYQPGNANETSHTQNMQQIAVIGGARGICTRPAWSSHSHAELSALVKPVGHLWQVAIGPPEEALPGGQRSHLSSSCM
jgi:hypothetical protein